MTVLLECPHCCIAGDVAAPTHDWQFIACMQCGGLAVQVPHGSWPLRRLRAVCYVEDGAPQFELLWPVAPVDLSRQRD